MIDGSLYGSGYEKHKSWLCLDWNSGQVRYEFKGLTTSSAVYADGRLYCLAEDGRAALLKPTPEQCEIEGRVSAGAAENHRRLGLSGGAARAVVSAIPRRAVVLRCRGGVSAAGCHGHVRAGMRPSRGKMPAASAGMAPGQQWHLTCYDRAGTLASQP